MGQSKNKSRKKNNEVIKLVVILLIAVAVIAGLVIAFGVKKINFSDYTEIKFSDMYNTNASTKEVSQKMSLLNGQKVMLSGYMAEQSPVDESFIYLVNQPYVVCPFCTVGDITKLEIMTVMMADGTGITFRTNAVNIYGTLEVEPRVDAFGYTTQFRILADRVINLEETEEDTAVNQYYRSLNEKSMIYDIQTLQMDIDSITNPDTIMMYYSTNEPVEVVDAIKADSSLDFTSLADYYGMSGQKAYVEYIKECPDIIESAYTNNDEKLIALNNELIDIYNKQIPIMEQVMSVLEDIKTKNMSDEDKTTAYYKLIEYKDDNLELFNMFNNWNNKLRE